MLSQPTLPANPEEPLLCPRCRAPSVVRAGWRHRKNGASQLYRCNGCGRRFSPAGAGRLRTPPAAILEALCLACQGQTFPEILLALRRRHRVEVVKSTLSKWLALFDPPYLQARYLNRAHRQIVRAHLFTHGGLNYNFKIHWPKLATCPHIPLRAYLERIPRHLDQALFNRPAAGGTDDTVARCSQLVLARNPGLREFSRNPVSSLAARALPLAVGSRQRHPVVEEFLLCCDRNTIAIETPVYLYAGPLGTITGHIDILQWSFGKIHVLDYKPNAHKEKPDKVVTQLTLYALGLSQRTGLPLTEFVCGYFDEQRLYRFTPHPLSPPSRPPYPAKSSYTRLTPTNKPTMLR